MSTKKQKKIDRRVFKKEGEELQQWLAFRKRGSRVESGKAYNRQKIMRSLIALKVFSLKSFLDASRVSISR